MENENVQQSTQAQTEAQKPTFDEILKTPEYQREFDKKLEGARQKWESKWQEKAKAEKDEAERLAKMSEEEKHQEALRKMQEEAQSARNELNAYKLKEEASKYATEKGLDLTFLDLFDYGRENAESIKTKLDDLDKKFKTAVEKSVNEKLRQPSPTQHKETTRESSFSRASY